jgi:peptide/nickel transport system ATP-binding protein
VSCLKIENLDVIFHTPEGVIRAVENVTFSHAGGESLALVGETGCGKSVIAQTILKLNPANARVSGRILFQDQNLLVLREKELAQVRGSEIGIILQNPTLSLNPVYSIGRQVSEMLRVHSEVRKNETHNRASALLKSLGFQDPEQKLKLYPFQLSEGMNQRVLIAAALIRKPRILIADEPTKGLDDRTKSDVLSELARIKDMRHTALFLITHDLKAARFLCDRVLVMYGGEIVEERNTEGFFKDPLHPYSRGLLGSLPEEGFTPIPGSPPSLVSPPSGCRYHPRCPERIGICDKERPRLSLYKGKKVRCFLYY